MRCFLAVPLEQPGLGDAQRLLHSLQEGIPSVRWVRPETLHVTMHFFGSLSEEQAQRGVDAVRGIAEQTPAFDAVLDRLGAFPERGPARVLWFGTRAEVAGFATLARACRAALGDAGFKFDRRDFRAHCTFGRPRAPWPKEAGAAWRDATAQPVSAAGFTASRLVLYESQHATGGNVYIERASVPFRGATR
jgi:2'-5' RNA ligase